MKAHINYEILLFMSDLSESGLVLLSIYVNPLTGYFKEDEFL
jgi:hypothetical protein